MIGRSLLVPADGNRLGAVARDTSLSGRRGSKPTLEFISSTGNGASGGSHC